MLPAHTALAGLEVALVGAGRVGRSFAGWIRASGGAVAVVAGREASSGGRQLAAELGASFTAVTSLRSARQQLLLLTTPAATLGLLANELAARPQAPVALHVAGSVGGEVLAPLAERGVDCGSLHPLRAFPRPLPELATAAATLFAVDGSAAASRLARRLAAAWGATAVEVPGDQRALYHLAATLCAGGAVAMLGLAARIAGHLGLDEAVVDGYRGLAIGALEAAGGGLPADRLTGPAARGEGTLLAQLEELRRQLPELFPAAVVGSLEVLRQVAAAGRSTQAHRVLSTQLAQLAGQPGFLDPLSRPVVSS